MESPYVTFSELKSGRRDQRVVARLLRFWPARNIKKGGQLMGFDLLLIDEKSTVMQGSINVNQLPTFETQLREGAMYVITGFEVSRSNQRYKLTDFHMSMRFLEATMLVDIEESFCVIPKELFRFRTHAELISLGNTNKELPDVIGQVCTTKAYRNGVTEKLERMLVLLRLESGEKVRLSAFDDHATSLDKIFSNKEAESCIMLATNINPKFFGGDLYLNATSGTKFYFDGEVEATRAFIESLKCNSSIEKYHGVQKIEHVSIAELNDFVVTANTEEAEFLCTAKIIGIQTERGWSFISCSGCGKKMIKEQSSLACKNCKAPNVVGDVKYRVEMVVDDGTNTTVFVGFDNDMAKLTNIQATKLAAQMADANPECQIPKLITDIVGKKFTFELKLTSFNFTTHHQSFTVSRIFHTPQEIPNPTFYEEVTSKRTMIVPTTSGEDGGQLTPNKKQKTN